MKPSLHIFFDVIVKLMLLSTRKETVAEGDGQINKFILLCNIEHIKFVMRINRSNKISNAQRIKHEKLLFYFLTCHLFYFIFLHVIYLLGYDGKTDEYFIGGARNPNLKLDSGASHAQLYYTQLFSSSS